ncbi:MAG TPA: hypothetical protein DDY13_19225 [Cytophagales bacterium]|jgi:hypothetical protein|nr:hypothetical protein [Cytophagales bacterium]
MRYFIIIPAILFSYVAEAQAQPVIINDDTLSTDIVEQLQEMYRVKILPGRYWYDKASGFWGMEGYPPAGIGIPGLNLGGPLSPEASKGNTGIFINGREITQIEQAELMKITRGPVFRGRYWLDQNGWVGFEGQGALVNLYQLAMQYYQQSSGSYFNRSWNTDIGSGGNSEGFYIMGEDWNYSSF